MKKKILIAILLFILTLPFTLYAGYYFYGLKFKNELLRMFSNYAEVHYKDYKIGSGVRSLSLTLEKPIFTTGARSDQIIVKFEKLKFQKKLFADEITIQNDGVLNIKFANQLMFCDNVSSASILSKDEIVEFSIKQRNISCGSKLKKENLGNLQLQFISEINNKKNHLIYEIINNDKKMSADVIFNVITGASAEYKIKINEFSSIQDLFSTDLTGHLEVFIANDVNIDGELNLSVENYKNFFKALDERITEPEHIKSVEHLKKILLEDSTITGEKLKVSLHGVGGTLYLGKVPLKGVIKDWLEEFEVS